MNTLPYKDILKTLGVFVLAFAIILVITKTISNISNTPTADKNTITISRAVDCPLDSKSYLDTKTNKNLILLENKNSHSVDGSFDKDNTYTISLKRTGLNSQIACGYLFYRVSDGNKPIEQKYEGLIMAPTDSRQFGGHLLPDEKSAISISEINNKTEFLIPLNNIPYDGVDRVNIKQVDWVSLLNVSKEIKFDIALNSIKINGHIDSVEIAYKCVNPQTGEETKDCQVELEK